MIGTAFPAELGLFLWPLSGIPLGAILVQVLLVLGLGALFGTVAGAAQWWLLRDRPGTQAGALIGLSALAGAASWLAGPLVTVVLGSLLIKLLPLRLAALILSFLSVATTGAVFGAISSTAWAQTMPPPTSTLFSRLPRGW